MEKKLSMLACITIQVLVFSDFLKLWIFDNVLNDQMILLIAVFSRSF